MLIFSRERSPPKHATHLRVSEIANKFLRVNRWVTNEMEQRVGNCEYVHLGGDAGRGLAESRERGEDENSG